MAEKDAEVTLPRSELKMMTDVAVSIVVTLNGDRIVPVLQMFTTEKWPCAIRAAMAAVTVTAIDELVEGTTMSELVMDSANFQ